MDSYTVLRNNKEYGPFTLQELKSQGLFTNDLIWIEGQSNAWRIATEVDAVKSFIKIQETTTSPAPTKKPIPAKPILQEKAVKSMSIISAATTSKAETIDNGFSTPHVEDFDTLYNGKKQVKVRRKQFSFSYNFLGLGILLIGAMLGAFILKQMVDGFGKEDLTTGEAKEILSQNVPVSTTTHTAEASAGPAESSLGITPVVANKDSMAVYIKPAPKQVIAAAQKSEVERKAALIKEPATGVTTAKDNSSSAYTKPVEVKEEKVAAEETKKPKSSGASLEISANDYKVGLFGGVSGLEISVTNTTSQNIDNAVVEVEFLRPNGSVVKTQNVSVQNIAAGASKKVPVPSSSRGVKVRYRIVSASAKEETIATDNM